MIKPCCSSFVNMITKFIGKLSTEEKMVTDMSFINHQTCKPSKHKTLKFTKLITKNTYKHNATPQPLLGRQTVTRNSFKDCQLAHKLPLVFLMCFILTHMPLGKLPRRSPILRFPHSKQALTMEFLRVGSRKRRCTFGYISSHFNPFKPHSGVKVTPT